MKIGNNIGKQTWLYHKCVAIVNRNKSVGDIVCMFLF